MFGAYMNNSSLLFAVSEYAHATGRSSYRARPEMLAVTARRRHGGVKMELKAVGW